VAIGIVAFEHMWNAAMHVCKMLFICWWYWEASFW